MLTPGIALIREIAKLIELMKPLIMFSANPIIAFTTALNAPPMAFPIVVPIVVNIPVMVAHIPLKNEPTAEKAPLIPSQAPVNIPLNHAP